MVARSGSKVTILRRSGRVLPDQMPDASEKITRHLAAEGIKIVAGVTLTTVRKLNERVEVETRVDGVSRSFAAERILVATCRRPNTDGLGLEAAGVELDAHGFVRVNGALQTSNSSIFVAAYEGAPAAENALSAVPVQGRRPRRALGRLHRSTGRCSGDRRRAGGHRRHDRGHGGASQNTFAPCDRRPRQARFHQTDPQLGD